MSGKQIELTGKKENKKGKRGAKEKYDPEQMPLLVEKWARLGLNDKQISENLNISLDTFYRYKKKYSEFSEALKRGKAPIDFQVENSLLKRALGYDVEVTHTEKRMMDGKEMIVIKRVVKHIPADVTAIIFWLKNRDKKRWGESSGDEDDTNEVKVVFE